MRNRVALAVGSSLAVLFSCAGNGSGTAAARDAVAAAAPVDSATALPPGGGCHPVGLLATGEAQFPLVNPEWAPVAPVPDGASPFSAPVVLHGAVTDSHVSREDFPSTHVTFDQNTSIAVDPQDAGLVATGNAREDGELELEWETGSYPAWAWAAPGDRLVAAGRWIFDCGHPDPEPGRCAIGGAACVLDSDCGPQGGTCGGTRWNYRSELHPPYAAAAIRSGRAAVLAPADGARGPAVPVGRADVWVSPDGGGAGDACVVTFKPDFASFIGAPCFPLSAPLALLPPEAPPLAASDFAFDIPLPPRTGAKVVTQVVPRDLPGGAAAVPARLELQPLPDDPSPRVHAVVHLTEPDASGRLPTGFAATILAGWRAGPRAALAHLRVTLQGVTVLDPLKAPPYPGVPVPDGWVMEASVNGDWQQVGGLDGVGPSSGGAVFPVSAAFDEVVAAGGTVPLVASAASRACNDTLFGHRLLDDLARFGFDTNAAFACLSDRKEPDAGSVTASIPVPADVAPHAYLVHAEGGGAAWALAFTVQRVPDLP